MTVNERLTASADRLASEFILNNHHYPDPVTVLRNMMNDHGHNCSNEARKVTLRDAAGYFHDGPWRCSRASRILEGLARGEARPDGRSTESLAEIAKKANVEIQTYGDQREAKGRKAALEEAADYLDANWKNYIPAIKFGRHAAEVFRQLVDSPAPEIE